MLTGTVFVITFEMFLGWTSSDNVNKAGKEISDWIQIGINCFIPHGKYQVKPHYLGSLHLVLMLHNIVTIISTSSIGANPWRIRSSLVLLGIIAKEFLKRPNPTMLMQLVTLLPLSILDHEMFGEYLIVFLTAVSLQFLLFLMCQKC